jgi:hypothetical protein
MTKTIAGSQQRGSGFWSKVKLFLEGLEGLDESYQERLERRVTYLEKQVARLVVPEKASQAAKR